MRIDEKYRHEIKYEISYGDYIVIKNKLKTVMKGDVHTEESGTYRINSLYFDNYQDKALREKINGAQKREKFRIRYYNNDTNFISLEKKMKVNHRCMKLSCRISKEECNKIMEGDVDWMMSSPNKLLHEFYLKIQHQHMRPKTIVSYIREPYVYVPGNVRITFDSDIQSGLYHTDFLDKDLSLLRVSKKGYMIMEVKYDEFLPEIICALIQNSSIRVGAFSKYAASRQYE